MKLRCILAFAALGCLPLAAAADELPLLGLARVSIRVADLGRARKFYSELAGYEEALTVKDASGATAAIYYKVNDLQFIEIIPGLTADEIVPMAGIAIRTDHLERLRAALAALDLAPGEIRTDRDGSTGFALTLLPGQELGALEFVQYGPGSLAVRAKGEHLGARRLSLHLEHAGIIATDFDRAYNFYVKLLGFHETWRRVTTDQTRVITDHIRMPGPGGDFLELSNQTGARGPLARARAGGAAHFALEVPEMKIVAQEVQARAAALHPAAPRYGLDNRWNFNLFDPDGTRMEFMQTEDPLHPPPAVVITPADFGVKSRAAK